MHRFGQVFLFILFESFQLNQSPSVLVEQEFQIDELVIIAVIFLCILYRILEFAAWLE